MQIFVSGGGDAKQSSKLDKSFINMLNSKDKILYVPIAMPVNVYSYKACFNWLKTTLGKYLLTNVDMWTDLKNRKLEELLKYKAVYIGGGNTFYLLDSFRKSGFSKILLKYIKSNRIVYGGSAGAIILGKHIGTAYFGTDSDQNLVGLKNLNGLNLFRGKTIQCHYTSADDSEIFAYVSKKKSEVIALPEETGLFVSNRSAKVIGYKDAYLFLKNKKIVLRKGKRFTL